MTTAHKPTWVPAMGKYETLYFTAMNFIILKAKKLEVPILVCQQGPIRQG